MLLRTSAEVTERPRTIPPAITMLNLTRVEYSACQCERIKSLSREIYRDVIPVFRATRARVEETGSRGVTRGRKRAGVNARAYVCARAAGAHTRARRCVYISKVRGSLK